MSAKEVRIEGLDKFYTTPECSKKCIAKVFELYKSGFDFIVEPSAGNGSFLNQLECENKIGIDIAPEGEGIIKMDFFDYTPLPTCGTNILVIGNPPFGKVSSLAIKFFNHAAKWSNVIAFIIPRTFRRPSVQNKLHKSFHLIHDEDIPIKMSFTPQIMVKCCFQIWEKWDEERTSIELPTKHEDWEFLAFGPLDEAGQPTPPDGADFAIRAYGGKIGEIKTENLSILRPKSWHWIKSNIEKNILIARFAQLDYKDSLNTARQNSMGKGELVRLYSNFINTK